MAFRVTNQMVARQTMRNIHASLHRLETHNRHLSTGKRIGLPSDDPPGTEISMRLRSTIRENEQYIQNVEDGISWLNATDSALSQVLQSLHRARTLVIDGVNGTQTEDARRAIAHEIDQLLQDTIQVGNLKHGHKFLFAGENTLTEAFEITFDPATNWVASVHYRGTPHSASGALTIEIGQGITMHVGTHGDVAIGPVVNALIEARDRMVAGDTDALSNQVLVQLDDAMDSVLRWQAEVGARSNRLELVKHRLEEGLINLQNLLSVREDVDVAESIMNLKMEENVYRLALASGARIIQPTLMDFLR